MKLLLTWAFTWLTLCTACPVATGQFLYRASATPHERTIYWWHWWEANRDAFLIDALAERWEEPGPVIQSAAGQSAINALLEASEAESPKLRMAVIRALGRIQTPRATDRLLKGNDAVGPAIADRDDDVRAVAWMSLGLIADDRCREALMNPPVELREESDHTARVIGIGLLPSLTPDEVDELLRQVKEGPGDEVRRLAVWAIGVHQPDQASILMPAVLRETPLAFASQEALLYPKLHDDPEMIDLARQALGFYTGKDRVPAFGEIEHWIAEIEGPWRSMMDHEKESFGIFLLEHGKGEAPSFLAARLQIAAALGLLRYGPITDQARHGPLIKELIRQSELSYKGDRPVVRGPALLAFAALAEHDTELDPLLNGLKGRVRAALPDTEKNLKRNYGTEIDDPARGFAALAIGLYLRRTNDDTAWGRLHPLELRDNQIASRRRELLGELWQELDKKHTPDERRAACLVAIGLSGDTGQGDRLVEACETYAKQSPLLTGHAVLALGLLGDHRTSEYGRWLTHQVTRGDRPLNSDQIAGARAALQGLALVGDGPAPSDIEALWQRDPWVGLEAATMMGWVQDRSAGGYLIEQLESDNPRTRIAAAYSLAELFEPERLSRLSRLYLGGHYMLTFRDQKPQVIDPNKTGFARFMNPRWWEEPDDQSRLHRGWPMRFPYLIAQPYLYGYLR